MDPPPYYVEKVGRCKTDLIIGIFERGSILGAGMPYSQSGACDEHVTNVSPNEIPGLVTSVEEQVKTASPLLRQHFYISQESLNEYKVSPRLFFGEYLSAQFKLLLEKAGIKHAHQTLYKINQCFQ